MQWKNRECEYPDRFTITDNGDNTYTITASAGAVVEAGTPINAENLNSMCADIEDNATDIGIIFKKFDKKYETITVANGQLQLLGDKIYQKASITNNTTIILPSVTSPVDICLQFELAGNYTVTLPSNAKYSTKPDGFVTGNVYELMLSYDGSKWLAGCVEYA